MCQWCGKLLRGKRYRWCSTKCSNEHRANHRWTQAKAKKKGRKPLLQCNRCLQLVDRTLIDVNHIKPCKGKHGQWGCWHHQDNLELLCRPCHKEVTREQRERGEL